MPGPSGITLNDPLHQFLLKPPEAFYVQPLESLTL